MKQCWYGIPLGKIIAAFVILLVLVLFIRPGVLAAASAPGIPDPVQPGSLSKTVTETVQARVYALPLSFIPSAGQVESGVAYTVTGPQSTLSFTPSAVIITIREGTGDQAVIHVIRQAFPGAEADPVIEGAEMLPGKANFFIGNDPSQWRSNVPTFGSVVYHDLYPGIDLHYRGTEGILKREFIVAPGANPAALRLHYEGIDAMTVDEFGALIITTGNSSLTESPVICFQEINGRRIPVSAGYYLSGDRDIAFSLGEYDPTFPLVIDPALVYSTYIGGSGDDEAYAIAVDSSGNAYVTGSTTSGAFPTTAIAYNHTFGGAYDAFVTKLNSGGTNLVYSTFLGGNSSDYGKGIAVDSSGNAYVTGATYSSDFPTTDGAYDMTFGGGMFAGNAFITKLNPAGSSLVYSTFLGTTGNDEAYAIAVDSSGNAYVTGDTSSGTFPTTTGAYNRTFGGARDAFITKLNTAGTNLMYSTFLGGKDWDTGESIALDSSGNAYVTGSTQSTAFPTTTGAYNRTYGGGSYDAFVTKLNSGGTSLVYSTFLGGDNSDGGHAIAVDSGGNAYVTGHTFSSNFPTTTGAYNRTYGGGSYDAFVTKLNSGGTSLVYSTFLGGADLEGGKGVAVDDSGNAYVTGYTRSSAFPTTIGAYNRTYGGVCDAFVTKLNATGKGLLYSTFLGGAGEEQGYGIAVDTSGNAFVTGFTYSDTFPTTAGAYDRIYGSAMDVFVTKLLPVPVDHVGVYRNSTHTFYLDKSGDGAWGSGDLTYSFGNAGDLPVAGDWDNNGYAEIGVFRNSTHTFYLDKSGNGAWGAGDVSYSFGNTGDLPVAGDWDNNGYAEIGVYRSSIHKFYLDKSGNGAWGAGDVSYSFGNTGDLPLAGDWNTDGRTEIGVYRSSIHKFYLDKSGNGAWGSGDSSFSFGNTGDLPLAGDWNGDGITEIGVYRPSTHKFYLDKSGNGAWGSGDATYTFGNAGDSPVAGAWG